MSNSFSCLGRIGKDAITRQAGSTTATSFSLANNVGYSDKQQTVWLNCTIWGDRGSKSAPYLLKGGQLWVTGELTQREYEGKTYLELNVSQFDFAGKKSDSDNTCQAQPAPQSQHHEQKSNGYAPAGNAPPADDDFGDFDNSIPF